MHVYPVIIRKDETCEGGHSARLETPDSNVHAAREAYGHLVCNFPPICAP